MCQPYRAFITQIIPSGRQATRDIFIMGGVVYFSGKGRTKVRKVRKMIIAFGNLGGYRRWLPSTRIYRNLKPEKQSHNMFLCGDTMIFAWKYCYCKELALNIVLLLSRDEVADNSF